MSRPPFHFFFCAVLLSCLGFAAESKIQTPTAPAVVGIPVTTIAEAFARWPSLTDDEQPMRIEGVVTGTMPTGAFRLNDGKLGLYITKSATGQQLTAGERVRVEGVLRKDGFSPWASPNVITRLGRGELPVARPASYGVLASGAEDNQWVEVEGVVRAAHIVDPPDFASLDLAMSGGNVRVLVNYEPMADYSFLVDATVRLRGVAAVNVSAQNRVVEASLRVPSLAEITVLKPGLTDPFSQPLVPVKDLMRSPLGAQHRHRIRTSGVVTRRLSDTTLFVRDGNSGLKIETDQPQAFRSGDRIEAAGFPVMAEDMAVLQHARCRVVGAASLPTPAEPTVADLLGGIHNSDLVRVRARLVDWVMAGRNVTLIFQMGDQLIKGLFNLPPDTALALPAKNSLVNVTGICVISELEDIWFYQPRSFLLLVADLADVQLIQAPTWWTPGRLWRALAITILVLLAAGGWVWALHRQIERKRAVIEQQARHAAALEERSRIARELHDTLEQGLTGLSLQMKAMETDLDGTPHPVRSRLQFARQVLRQSRALARNAIRELRTEAFPTQPESLVDGLKCAADLWNHSGALRATVRIDGNVRPLPPQFEHHLLGIGTEAMTNAVKHGRAETIDVAIEFGAEKLVIRVKDNGVGFEPAPQLEQASGCFGLLGMRERASEVRGDLRIVSQPGHGTEVIVSVPVPRDSSLAADYPAAPATEIKTVAPATEPLQPRRA
jgi:signal transduction histidine kinase